MPILKHLKFRDLYNSNTLNAKSDWNFGKSGLLRGGDISVQGLTVTIQPMVFVQNGLVIETTDPVDIAVTAETLSREHTLAVSVATNVETALEVLAITIIARPEDLNDQVVQIAGFDGEAYRKLPYLSIDETQLYNYKHTVLSGGKGILEESKTSFSGGVYTSDPGVVTDSTGVDVPYPQSEDFEQAPLDPDYPDRIDEIVVRRNQDGPARPSYKEYIVGDAYNIQGSSNIIQATNSTTATVKSDLGLFSPKNISDKIALWVDDYGSLAQMKWAKATGDLQSFPAETTIDNYSTFGADNDDNGLLYYVAVQRDDTTTLAFNVLDLTGSKTIVSDVTFTQADIIDSVKISVDQLRGRVYIFFTERNGSPFEVKYMSTNLIGQVITSPLTLQATTIAGTINEFDVHVDDIEQVAYLGWADSGQVFLKSFDLDSGNSVTPPNEFLDYGDISDDSAFAPTESAIAGSASNPVVRRANNKEIYVCFEQIHNGVDKDVFIFNPNYKDDFGFKSLSPFVPTTGTLGIHAFIGPKNDMFMATIRQAGSDEAYSQQKIDLYTLEVRYNQAVESADSASSPQILRSNTGVVFGAYFSEVDDFQQNNGSAIPSLAFGPGSFNGEPINDAQFVITETDVNGLPRDITLGDQFVVTGAGTNNGAAGIITNLRVEEISSVNYYIFTTNQTFTYETGSIDVQFSYTANSADVKIFKTPAEKSANEDVLSIKEIPTDVWASRTKIRADAAPAVTPEFETFNRPNPVAFNPVVKNLYEFLNMSLTDGGTLSWGSPGNQVLDTNFSGSSDDTIDLISDSIRGVQTFTPTVTGNLDRVDLSLHQNANGNSVSDYDVYVEIFETSGGEPTGSPIGSTQAISYNSLPASGTYAALINNPEAPVNAATLYAAVVRTDGNPVNGYNPEIDIHNTADIYLNGQALNSINAGTNWNSYPASPIQEAFASDLTAPGTNGFELGPGSPFIANLFTPIFSGDLVTARISIDNVIGSPTGNVKLELRSTSQFSLSPNNILATSDPVDVSTISTNSIQSFTFPAPANVKLGYRYFIVLTTDGANNLDGANYIRWSCNGINSSGDIFGSMQGDGASTWLALDSDRDLGLSVDVDVEDLAGFTGIVTSPFSSVANFTTTTDWRSQSFTSANDGNVDNISVALHAPGGALSGNIFFQLREDSAGLPGAVLDTSDPFDSSVISALAIFPYQIPFSSNPAVVQGQKYWITMDHSATTVSGGTPLIWGAGQTATGSSNAFPSEGNSSSSDSGSSWGAVAPQDLALAVRLQPELVTGSITDLSFFQTRIVSVGATDEFRWSADINIHVYGRESFYKIAGPSQVTLEEGDIAYVKLPKDPNSSAPLTMQVENSSSLYYDTDNLRILPIMFRINNNLYSRWSDVLQPGEESTPGFGGSVPQDLLDFIGAQSETDNAPNFPSNNYVIDGDNLVQSIGVLDAQLYFLATLKPNEEVFHILSNTDTVSSAGLQWDANNEEIDIVVYKNGQKIQQELTATLLDPSTTEDFRKTSPTQLQFARDLIAGDKLVIRKENAAGGSGGSLTVKQNGLNVAVGINKLNFTGAGWTVTDAGGGQTDISFAGGSSSSSFLKSVYNNSGGVIPAGSVLAWQNDGSVDLADANLSALSDFAGIATASIPDQAFGQAAKAGNVSSVLTSLSPTPGDTIYMGTTPGTFTLVAPAGASDSIVKLGRAEPADGVFSSSANDLFIELEVVSTP